MFKITDDIIDDFINRKCYLYRFNNCYRYNNGYIEMKLNDGKWYCSAFCDKIQFFIAGGSFTKVEYCQMSVRYV